MKQTRLALALLVTSLAATPAFAASITMLQFGSFETRAEAEKQLANINGKYASTLGTLPTSIREVKLPPDNLTVYRTQAGPVTDRKTAQDICSKLAASGDECYIAQTAMINAPAASAVAANTATPVAVPASTDLTSKLSTLQPDVDTRDPLNRAALNSVNTPLADNAAPAPSSTEAAADTSASMQTALDKAAADQVAVANDISTSTAQAQPAQRSFWSRLNPFSAAPAATVTAKAPEPLPTAAPVEPVATAALETPPAPEPVAIASAPKSVPPMNPVVVAPIAPAPIVPAVKTSPNGSFDNSPVIAQAPTMQLPPPPAPLKAQDAKQLTAGKAPLPAPEPVAAPINVTPLPPGTPAGTVQVEEAKRVPVTTATTSQMPTGAVPVATPIQAPVSLRPSATEGIKTIWAQMGPFASNDEALGFWANYRQNHPDFPVVRVRVTSSYQQLMHGQNSYWLRVGPMAQKAFVSNLCASVNPPTQSGEPANSGLKCGIVSDMGVSSPLMPQPGMLPASRYNRH